MTTTQTTTATSARKPRIAAGLGGAVAALALCVALVGCGGGAGLAGTWKAVDEDSDVTSTLELKGDGSAKLSLEGDGNSMSFEGTWEEQDSGDGSIKFDAGSGNEGTLDLSDDGSQLDYDGITFDRA